MTNPTLSRDVLWSRLARERQMISLMEKEMIPLVEPFARKRENWVPMWVDLGHRVTCETGMAVALRAISDRGELLWFVRQDGQRLGYHSQEADPVAALAEARTARIGRKAVRQRWDDVTRLRYKILRGKHRFRVTRDDAYASPLCAVGIDGFMRRFGMGRVQSVPARLLAAAAVLDEQVGFVLWQAWQRHQATLTAPQTSPQVAVRAG
ncbi:MAG: hypothetical protein AAFP98_00680 [Pseudomonadota bacterium]